MQPINRITRIVTHTAPHLDEIFAIWLLRQYGEEQFPGISTAPVEYWDAEMAETSADDHLADGTLLVGVGGGRFDEHPREGSKRKAGHCASSLVAAALGVGEDEALQRMLDYIINDDLHGSNNHHDLASIVVTLNREHPDDPQLVNDWATTAIQALLAHQLRFFEEVRTEYEEKAHVVCARWHRNKLRIVSIESDNLQIVSYARSKHGGRAAIVIVRKSNGQTAIMSNPLMDLKLNDLARIVRVAEQRAKGGQLTTRRWKDLEAEGTIAGAEEWYYQLGGEMLLNGSPTHPEVPPTHLTLQELTELAKIAFSSRVFEPERQETCRAGTCSNSATYPCPWYDFGLARCKTIRFRTAHPEAR